MKSLASQSHIAIKDQSRIISKDGSQISIHLTSNAFGTIDVRAVLYKGGMDSAKISDMTLLVDRTFRSDKAHDAQSLYDQTVIVLA